MYHEGDNLHQVRLFNLRKGHNNGNQWWIVAYDGTPVESWKDEKAARFILKEHNAFRARHNVPPAKLYRCMPGIGFILLTQY